MLKNALRLFGFLLMLNFVGFLVQLSASERQTPPPILKGGTDTGGAAAPPTLGVGSPGCGCGSARTSTAPSPGLSPGESRVNELSRQISDIDNEIQGWRREQDIARKMIKDAEAARNNLEESGPDIKSTVRAMRWEAADSQIQEQQQRLAEIERKIAQLETKKRALLEEYNTLSGSAGRKAGRDYQAK